MSKQEHKYAQVLRWIADGESVEIRWGRDPSWMKLSERNEIVNDDILRGNGAYEFRITPRTVTVNGVECVAPETVEPKFGTMAWIAHPVGENWAIWLEWIGSTLQKDLFSRGLVFLCEEHAVAYAKAMYNYKDGEK